MSLAEQLVKHLAARHWEPSELVDGDDRLEVLPMHGKLEAGFPLWRQDERGRWRVVSSGHTLDGRLVTPQEDPLPLSDELEDRIARLLRAKRG